MASFAEFNKRQQAISDSNLSDEQKKDLLQRLNEKGFWIYYKNLTNTSS